MKKVSVKLPAIKPEMFIAVFAIFISLSTLFVYIYQSSLMKQQQQMSVWPYLSYGPSWGYDYFRLNLINKGIGPAIVKSFEISYDGKKLENIHELMLLVPDSLRSEYMYSALWPGMVIMAGEEVSMFKTTDPKTVQYIVENLINDKIYMDICYSSVYGDTWVSYGLNVEESKCK
ncbi:MAG: hypothetical protein JJU28_05590 [Cyclobacteriaceae bacterium]|nr:hypothetical protein [Cyclobacteriaceae bacterium]